MFLWSLPAAVPFLFVSSTSNGVISGISIGLMWIMVPCHIVRTMPPCSFYDLILIMDVSTLLVYERNQSVLTYCLRPTDFPKTQAG